MVCLHTAIGEPVPPSSGSRSGRSIALVVNGRTVG
jgi:hypothetical protein